METVGQMTFDLLKTTIFPILLLIYTVVFIGWFCWRTGKRQQEPPQKMIIYNGAKQRVFQNDTRKVHRRPRDDNSIHFSSDNDCGTSDFGGGGDCGGGGD